MTTVKRTARLTGLAYLGLAISGMLGFLLVRGQLYLPGDAAATTANLLEHEALARFGIAADLTVVLTQALAALLFFALFRGINALAAGALAAFGLVNAAVILVATAFSATALDVALEAAAQGSDGAATTQLLYGLSDAAWTVGGLFFGLWLIPMGWLVWHSGSMPRPLGWILIVGGAGYILSTFVAYLAPGLAESTSVLTIPASVGEFWMIGYLLWNGLGAKAAVALDETSSSRRAAA